METKYKFKTLGDFRKSHVNEYNLLRYRGLLGQLCEDMGWGQPKKHKPQGYWTEENFILECKKFNSYNELKKSNPSAIECARTKGYLENVVKSLGWEKGKTLNRKPINWTKEKCLESAFKYKTKISWEKGDTNAHAASRRHGWYDECTKHMGNLINVRGYWTKERCLENALLYKIKEQWKKENYAAHSASRRHGSYLECTKHMDNLINANGYWTKERCLEEGKKYTSMTEWRIGNQTSHNKARKNGWHKELKELINGK
jgi:hypothetical protein